MCAAPVPVPPTVVTSTVASGLPLEAARAALAWLCRGPRPVAVDGRRLPGLPRRRVPVDELADRLADPYLPGRVRDAVWAHLVRRARAEGATWTVVCAGLAAPALEHASHRLTASHSRLTPARRPRSTVGRVEIEAAVLTGFLAELAVVDLRRPGIGARLVEAGFEAGRAARREIRAAPRPRPALFSSTPPPAPARHPDLVLARAVADRALTHQEAVLIGATRLEPMRLADLARARRQTLAQTRAARIRAERKLSAYLRDPDRAPHHPTEPATTSGIDTASRSGPAGGTSVDAGLSRLPRRRRRPSRLSPRVAVTDRLASAATDAEGAAPRAKPETRRRRGRAAAEHELGAGEPHRHPLRRHRHRSGPARRRAATDRATGRPS